MKTDVRVLVLAVCMMISMTLMMTFFLLPHDDDKHFELDLQPSHPANQIRLPGNLTISPGSGGNGTASSSIGDTVYAPEPDVVGQQQKPSHRVEEEEEALTTAEFEELNLGTSSMSDDAAKHMKQCEDNIAGEQGKGYRQMVQQKLKQTGIWPTRGPDFGGKEVALLPHSPSAKGGLSSLHCQFGTALAAAGYDAFYDMVVCSPTPRVHQVQRGQTLDSVRRRYNIPLEALLELNPGLGRRQYVLDVGQRLVLQEEQVDVRLVMGDGTAITGETAVLYRYAPLAVHKVWPQSAVTDGGGFVTVSGRGFEEAEGGGGCHVRCRFGGHTQLPAQVLSPTLLRCAIPPLPTADLDELSPRAPGTVVATVTVHVSSNGADFTPDGPPFTYFRRTFCVPPAPAPPPPAIAVLSSPKPLRGLAAVSQLNALRSWHRLFAPKGQIFLASRDEAVEAFARQHDARVLPVETNAQGTPLVSSMVALALEASRAELLLLVNADILLFQDLLEVVAWAHATFDEFLLVGRRTNVNTSVTKMAARARTLKEWNEVVGSARKEGEQHTRWALDYFVFSRNLFPSLPPFAFGRPAYDNYLLRTAVEKGVAVIDVTHLVTAVHQNHRYAHVDFEEASERLSAEEKEWEAAMRKEGRERDAWETMASAEIEANRQLAGAGVKLGTTDHATWVALPCSYAEAYTHHARPQGHLVQ